MEDKFNNAATKTDEEIHDEVKKRMNPMVEELRRIQKEWNDNPPADEYVPYGHA